jgi:hypothetical protein
MEGVGAAGEVCTIVLVSGGGRGARKTPDGIEREQRSQVTEGGDCLGGLDLEVAEHCRACLRVRLAAAEIRKKAGEVIVTLASGVPVKARQRGEGDSIVVPHIAVIEQLFRTAIVEEIDHIAVAGLLPSD